MTLKPDFWQEMVALIPATTVSELSQDTNSASATGGVTSVVNYASVQLNFDEYAREFANSRLWCQPASCDQLSKYKAGNGYCFVEYKNGDIVAFDNKTKRRTIKASEAKKIEKKLYDSALMLEYEKRAELDDFRKYFQVLIVVQDRYLRGPIKQQPQKQQPQGKYSLSVKTLGLVLQQTALSCSLRSMTSLAEQLYAMVRVVSASYFEKVIMPTFETVSYLSNCGEATQGGSVL